MKLITLLTMATLALALAGCKPTADSGVGGTSTNAPGGMTTNSMSSPDLQTPQPVEQPAPVETTPPPQQ